MILDLKLPPELQDLSMKKQQKLADICTKERKDAAVNVVLLGIKGLNHVHKYGLERLSRISTLWSEAITEHYKKRDVLNITQYAGNYGDFVTDPISVFSDLSDRRIRLITKWLAENRREAHDIAFAIGQKIIKKECGFGEERMSRLNKQWQRDICVFYEERDVNEPLLIKWIEEIGFIYENGGLKCYRDASHRAIRKQTAEKWMEEDGE